MSHGPTPSPIRLLIRRKLADAVARIGRGTRCCTAVTTGPSHRILTALPTRRSGQATHRLGAKKPRPHAGTEMSQAMAGSFAYQLLSVEPRRSANQPPANTPAQPPMRSNEARKLPVETRSRPKLSIITFGVHSARP